MRDYQSLLNETPDPVTTANRMEQLKELASFSEHFEKLAEEDIPHFLNLITTSNFIFRYLCRKPESMELLFGKETFDQSELDAINDLKSLRCFKYQELIKISWLDICERDSYQQILNRLSHLAECIIEKAFSLVVDDYHRKTFPNDPIPFVVFAMGKLGAAELNFSSDVDLIFVSRNQVSKMDYLEYQEIILDQIRRFNHAMENRTDEGFLYRIDLKLRPWGRSGPLVMSIDETEHYYEGSSEAWERFAWLRARSIAGDTELGEDLLERINPFIYLRSIGSDDLDRFIQIKKDMSQQRKRSGSWNIKLGDGGIRDIEFFIQMLQLVNAAGHDSLKITSTLKLIEELIKLGFLGQEEGRAIEESYLFLRRLENRLQMVDELQTHELSDEKAQRTLLASSLGFGPGEEPKTLKSFTDTLERHRQTARACFERILPKES